MKKRTQLFAVSFTLLILTSAIASAGDVAYLYRKTFQIDKNIIDVFEELGLTVDYIQEKNQPSSYSGYRLIFVGDENFRANIPVNNYPSVIVSYYDAERWGLTDEEGISQMGANAPMSVVINSHQTQVYTQALIQETVAVPYYYLDIEDKTPGMQQVAATETTESGFKIGDVISYAPIGTQMSNGKTQQAELCFFGIVESDYWTPAAKELFVDCVNYVAAECSQDSDCPAPTTSAPFCVGNDVYFTQYSNTCENTLLARCVAHEQDIFSKTCPYSCLDGQCAGECNNNADCDDSNSSTEDICHNPQTPQSFCTNEPIECSYNSDCGTDGLINQPTCSGLNVVQDYKTFTCNNPGTAQSSCSSSISQQILETCSDICVNGECKDIECYNNADCGTDGLIGELFCTGDNVFRNFKTFTCNNPGTPESSCSSSISPQLIQTCQETCLEGICVDIECNNNADCGTDGLINQPTCSGLNVVQDYKTFTCHNPATPSSSCSSSITQQILETCSDICVNGACHDVECDENSDCNDANPLTLDECINPGTIISDCRNTPINCNNNLDCGFTGFFGNEFCSNDDIVKNYQLAVCHNPNTLSSSCDLQISQETILSCPYACHDAACIRCDGNSDCNDQDSDTLDICRNPGELNSYCENQNTTPQNIDCYTNADCGTNSPVSQLFCSLNNVNQLFLTWTCNNPATIQSYCSSSFQQQIIQTCPDICQNGQCIGITCYNNADCGTDGLINQPTCSGLNIVQDYKTFPCHNPATPSSSCSSSISPQLIQICSYACAGGSCIGQCIPGQTQQCGNSNVGECEFGTKTCNSYGSWNSECVGEVLPSNEICDGKDNDCDSLTDENNICPPVCSNECSSSGTSQCYGAGYRVCGNFDADSCLEWSSVTTCNYGCANGNCNPQPPITCTNECSFTGQRQCTSAGYRICGNFDADSCLDWSLITQCGLGAACTSGYCV